MAAFAADIEWYYLDDEANNMGPFTTQELSDYYASGAVKDGSFVWHEDIEDGEWKSLTDVASLKDELERLSEAKAVATAPDADPVVEAEAKVDEAEGAAEGGRRGSVEHKSAVAEAKAKTMSRAGSKKALPVAPTDNLSLLKMLSQKKYVDQAQWFLNAYWEGNDELVFGNNPEERERVWKYCHACSGFDKKLGDDGNELDEFEAHMFLEKQMGALTVQKMREVLREMDVDFNQKVSLTEFLIYHYRVDYNYLVTAVVNDEESERMINEAKALLEAAEQALADSQARAKEAADAAAAAAAAAQLAKEEAARAAEAEKAAFDAEAQAVADEEAAKQAEQAAKDAVVELEAAVKEQEEALAKLEAEQKAYDDECARLEAEGNDESLGIVKRNTAKNTLAQLQQKDPLPLNAAKINQGAAVRKVEKQKKKAEKAAEAATVARKQAEQARADATAAREAATAAKLAAEEAAAAAEEAANEAKAAEEAAAAAVLVAEKAVEEASIALEEVKEKCQNATTQGTLWWMDRQWEEQKKYMSESMIRKMEARRNKN